jgi:hypothetical protein
MILLAAAQHVANNPRSDWFLTKGELALAIPAGTILGAVIAWFGVRSSNKANMTRMKAERQWDARARVYADTIGHLNRFTSTLRSRTGKDKIYPATDIETLMEPFVEYLWKDAPNVFLFNSDSVEERVREVLQHISEFQAVVTTRATEMPGTITAEEVAPFAERIYKGQKELVTAIQNDLK